MAMQRIPSNHQNPPVIQGRQKSSAEIIEVPEILKAQVLALQPELQSIKGDLSQHTTQEQIRELLMENALWAKWIDRQGEPLGLRPRIIRSGLGIELDDDCAHKILVGLARSLQPQHFVPPYSMGNLAVTEVIAGESASKESHSENDLPAPPHTAGFFEDTPPHTCYFACVRPHAGGGAETTVVDLDSIFQQAPQALIDQWRSKEYILKNSKRLGCQERTFQLLQDIEGLPFLRYRKEYTPGFNKNPSLLLLEELITNQANHYIVPLQAGEILIHWNGAPHSRMPQKGATPKALSDRRKLIRCRSQPSSGWENKFNKKQGDNDGRNNAK